MKSRTLGALTLNAAALLLAPLAAAQSTWQSGGPDGGEIRGLLATRDGRQLYALTRTNGVFRTRDSQLDRSLTWEKAGQGLPPFLGWFSGSDESLYAAGYQADTVWRSVDGGDTWTEGASIGAGLGIVDVQANPADPLRVWVAVGSGKATEGVILESLDGGESWLERLELDVGWWTFFAAAPGDSETLYVLGGLGLMRTRDAGRTWTTLAVGPRALAVDPRDADHLWALNHGDVAESVDGGDTWQAHDAFPPSTSATRSIAVKSDETSTVAALAHTQLALTRDGGASWSVQDLPRECISGGTVVFSDREVVVGTNGGICASSDEGRNWRVSESGLRAAAVTPIKVASRPGHLLAGGGYSGGPWVSDDGGRSWRLTVPPKTARGIRFGLLEASSEPPAEAFLASWGSRRAQFFSSTDDGQTWTEVKTTEGFWSTFSLGEDGALYAGREVQCGNCGSAVVRSEDGGRTWNSFMGEQTLGSYVHTQSIAQDPSDFARSFVTLWEGYYHRCALFETVDAGATWEELLRSSDSSHCVESAVAIDPSDPFTLYYRGAHSLSTTPAPASATFLYRSRDRGATWEDLSDSLPCMRTLAVHPTDSTVLAGCDRVFSSSDFGESWSEVTTAGLPQPLGFISSLVVELTEHGEILHAGTNAGLFSLRPDPGWESAPAPKGRQKEATGDE